MFDFLNRRARDLPAPSKSPPKAMGSLDSMAFYRQTTYPPQQSFGIKRRRSCSPDGSRQAVEGTKDDMFGRPHKVRFIYRGEMEELEELKEKVKDLLGQRKNIQTKLQEVSDQFSQQEQENRTITRNLAAAEEALEMAARVAEVHAQELGDQSAVALHDANAKIKALEDEVDRLTVQAEVTILQDTDIEELRVHVCAQDDEIKQLRASLSESDAALAEASERDKRLRYVEADLFHARSHGGEAQQLRMQTEAQREEIEVLQAALANANTARTEAGAPAPALDPSIDHLKAELSEARSKHHQQVQVLQAQVNSQEDEIKRLQEVLSDTQTALSAAGTTESEVSDLGLKIRDLEAELSDARAAHAMAETLKTRVHTQDDEIQRLRASLAQVESVTASQISDQDKKIKVLEAELSDAQALKARIQIQSQEVQRLQQVVSDAGSSLAESRSALADAHAAASNTSEALKSQLRTQREESQRLQQALSDAENSFSESQSALLDARAAASNASDQDERIRVLEAELSDTQALKTQVQNQDDEIQRLQRAFSDAESSLVESRSALANARTAVSTTSEALRSQVQTQSDENQRLQQVLSDTEKSLAEARSALVDARAAASNITAQNERIRVLEADLSDARAERTVNEALKTRIQTQDEEIQHLHSIISDTKTSLSAAAASAEASNEEVERLQGALAAALRSSESKDSEIARLSDSASQSDTLRGELQDEVIGLKNSLENAEVAKNSSAEERLRLEANLAAGLREHEQLQSTVRQQLEALRSLEEEKSAKDTQIDLLNAAVSDLNETITGLNERLTQSQDLLQEEYQRYRQLSDDHNWSFDQAVEERQRLEEQLEHAQNAAQEERENHQRVLDERHTALEHGRNEAEGLRAQIEEGKRALEEQRTEFHQRLNSDEVARLREVIDAQNEEIEVTEQTITTLRAEIEARDANDPGPGTPTRPSTRALGKRRAGGSSSTLMLALSRSPLKRRSGGTVATTSHQARPSAATSSHGQAEDAQTRAPTVSADDIVHGDVPALGNSNADTLGGPSRQRQATPGPSNQHREGTPLRSLSQTPFLDVGTRAPFSALAVISEESVERFNGEPLIARQATSSLPHTPSHRSTPASSSRPIPQPMFPATPTAGPSNHRARSVPAPSPRQPGPFSSPFSSPHHQSLVHNDASSPRRAPIPQPFFTHEAAAGDESGFRATRTAGPSYHRAASCATSVPVPGPSTWQPSQFSSPFSSPHRQPSVHNDASSPHQVSNVFEAIDRLGQRVDGMEDNIVDRICTRIQPQPARPPKTPRRDPSSPHKPKSERRIRDPERVALQTAMRPVMNKMLGIKQDKDISTAVAEGHFVTEEEADELLCDDDHMMENLDFMKPLWSSLTSAYNDTLANIFWTAFVPKNPAFELDEEDGNEYFQQRLKTLRSKISAHTPAPDESEEQAAERIEANYMEDLVKGRNRKRKWEGFSSRISDVSTMADSDPSYAPILHVLTELGVDGYSSDESCDEGYSVRWMPWRNRKLQKLVDAANRARQTHGPNGNRLSGPSKRTRVYRSYPPVTSRQAPQELPINFYDDAWYRELKPHLQRQLGAKPPMPFPWEFDN